MTVDRSLVDGGILFDASQDGETPSGMGMRGYVTDSVVRGGVRYHAGATGFVRGRLDGDVVPVADAPPAGAIVDPGDGAWVAVGQRVEPVVAASDDVRIGSVTLTASGRPVGRLDRAPYAFAWTPRRADAGRTVTRCRLSGSDDAVGDPGAGQEAPAQVTLTIVENLDQREWERA